MAQTIPSTRATWLVTISGLDFYFNSFSGIEDKAESTPYSDGLTQRLFNLVGPRKLQDMTMGKDFDPVNDKALIDWFQTYCPGSNLEKTISIVPVRYCPNPEPIGSTAILYGVKPISLKFAEVDRKSNDISMLELGISADYFVYS